MNTQPVSERNEINIALKQRTVRRACGCCDAGEGRPRARSAGRRQQSNRTPVILVADDDDDDVFLLRRAFSQAGFSYPIVSVHNGSEAIQYLGGAGCYGDRQRYPWPSLVLLDLKMPVVSGFEVLAWAQQRQEMRGLPAVILSSSGFDSDIERARELGACDYFVKPQDLNALVELARTVNSRWLTEAPDPLERIDSPKG